MLFRSIALLLQVGALGPWLGIALTMGLIAVIEAYLQRRQAQAAKEQGMGSGE